VDSWVDAYVDACRDTPRVDLPSVPGATWLVDVGFGDSFVEPLLFFPNLEQSQIGRIYRLVEIKSQSELETGRIFCLEVRADSKSSQNPLDEEKPIGETWKRPYSFTLQPRELSDFAPMCRYHQTSRESYFMRQRICSRATPEGRITLSDWKLIETRNGNRTEHELAGDHEWRATLREMFEINLSGGAC
jgi:N-hydroxyarylamine O-acetyltransferase